MNSGMVSGQSVSPTADLTYLSTQLAFAFALAISAASRQILHDLEAQDPVLGKILKLY